MKIIAQKMSILEGIGCTDKNINVCQTNLKISLRFSNVAELELPTRMLIFKATLESLN